MVTMRGRRTILAVAAAYALSFLVVCLGTCFAAQPVAEHACCAGQDGFRAMAHDCCLVTPGTATDGPVVAHAAPSTPAVTDRPEAHPLMVVWARGTALAASPPLVLRI